MLITISWWYGGFLGAKSLELRSWIPIDYDSWEEWLVVQVINFTSLDVWRAICKQIKYKKNTIPHMTRTWKYFINILGACRDKKIISEYIVGCCCRKTQIISINQPESSVKINNHCYLKVVSWCMALRKENGTNPEIGSEKMENGDWTLTKKTWSQESDAISDTAEITIYYTALFLVLYWMENKIIFSVSCATQHINLYFPRYFPYRLSLEMCQCTFSTSGSIQGYTFFLHCN